MSSSRRPVSALRLIQLISVHQLRTSWARTILVVAGTLTGVALIVGIEVINRSVLTNARRTIELIAGPADLEVILGFGEVGFPESTVETVRADPGVRAAVPLVRGTISLTDEPNETLQLFGADLTAEEDLQRYSVTAVTSRRQLVRTLEDPRSILLTEVFASRRNVRVGDAIRLSTPEGVEDFRVCGLLRTEGLAAAFGGQLAVMDLPVAQRWLAKEERIDQIDVVLQPGASPEEVERRLAATLSPALTITRPAQRGLQYERILGSFQAMLTGLSSLCLIAGIFIIYNTTSTGALHRALVMAGLRRIGAIPTQVFQLFMLEALILGIAGTVLGIVAGLVLARLLIGMVTESKGVIFQLRFPAEADTLGSGQLTLIALVGIGATLFASYFAARRVALMDPLDVMRAYTRRPVARNPPRGLVAWWAALVAVSAAALACEQQFKSVAWGNFGATLWNASVIVIAIPLVGRFARGFSRILGRLFGAEGEVAATSVFRSVTRTGVTVAAIALVLTVAISVSSLVSSCRDSLRRYFEGFLSGDLSVSAVSTEGGWLETPLSERIRDELLKVPGVRDVEPARVISGQPYRGQRIGLLALSESALHPQRYPPGWFREGEPSAAADAVRRGNGVLISVSLSDRFSLHVEDQIELDTPTGLLVLPIVGVVPDYISDRGSVILSRTLLIERWLEHTVNRFALFLQPSASLEAVRASITERLGHQYRLKILSLSEVLAYHADKVDQAFAFTDAIQLLIVIVTVAGILDLMLSSIAERRRELALWRLIGADDRTIVRSVVLESATVAVISILLGVAVGVVTAWIWITINFRYLLGYYVDFQFAVGSAVWYASLVFLMTIATGYVAARQATRQPVLEGIRVD